MILTFITTFAVGWTFVMGFNTVEFIYGDRIKAWLQGKKEEKRNYNLVKEFDKKINADIAKSMLPEEIPLHEVEDLGCVVDWDNVTYKRDHKEEIISFELEIVSNGNS